MNANNELPPTAIEIGQSYIDMCNQDFLIALEQYRFAATDILAAAINKLDPILGVKIADILCEA